MLNLFVYDRKICKCKIRLRNALLKITNSVYRSSLNNSINLKFIASQVPSTILYNTQSQMLNIVKEMSKLVFFKSGKFRLMGGGFHPTRRNAHRQLSKFFPLLPQSIVSQLKHSKLTCQTITVTFSLFCLVNLECLYAKLLCNKEKKCWLL